MTLTKAVTLTDFKLNPFFYFQNKKIAYLCKRTFIRIAQS